MSNSVNNRSLMMQFGGGCVSMSAGPFFGAGERFYFRRKLHVIDEFDFESE